MFHKILIANRGEIAVRIIRACRNMGIRSVAVYSKEDKDSLHVQLADQRICIGEGPARNNYLNMQQIVTAALNIGADAIHHSSLYIFVLPRRRMTTNEITAGMKQASVVLTCVSRSSPPP